MSEVNAIFTLDGLNLTIKCTTEDKMKNICENYSNKINKNMNSLIFLYGGNKVNFDLSFEEQVNSIDRSINEMKILVILNENNTKSIKNKTISNNIIRKSISGSVDCLKNGNLLDNIKSNFFCKILFSLFWMKKLN